MKYSLNINTDKNIAYAKYKERFNALYILLANDLLNKFEITRPPGLVKPWF